MAANISGLTIFWIWRRVRDVISFSGTCSISTSQTTLVTSEGVTTDSDEATSFGWSSSQILASTTGNPTTEPTVMTSNLASTTANPTAEPSVMTSVESTRGGNSSIPEDHGVILSSTDELTSTSGSSLPSLGLTEKVVKFTTDSIAAQTGVCLVYHFCSIAICSCLMPRATTWT